MIVLTREAMTLGEFFKKEMERMRINSNRAFAEKTGVSSQLINDVINETGRVPDLVSLAKIANVTGTALVAYLKLAFPEVVRVDVDVDEIVYAEMMSKLPPDKQDIARRYIDSNYRESGDE